FREIAFLSKAYREVMILRYLEGMPIPAVAKALGLPANTVRQRLFYARNAVRNEVQKMANREDAVGTPLALQNIQLRMIGTGNPLAGDPRDVCTRQLSSHIVWLCRCKPSAAREISQALGVPMPYVEEELAIQCAGSNGEYGMLQQLENGRYAVNVLLLDKPELEKAQAAYTGRIPALCQTVCDFVQAHREEYLAFPYLNKRVDMNLILWQQISWIAYRLSGMVDRLLDEEYFPNIPASDRPFTVFGYRSFGGPDYGCGWDGVRARHIAGYSSVSVENIYISRISAHFHCGHDIGNDLPLQLAIRAVGGLPVAGLSEEEKEAAARAVECGYLYREGDTLYTKILVSRDGDDLFAVSAQLDGPFRPEAEQVAAAVAQRIREDVPAHLIGDRRYFNALASLPVLDSLVEALIGKGLLTPPQDGLGAEGCWMTLTP
ncbi:MAG TPA: sigma-70 family RNA polymerase sigma factor, partial [Firmicutes bacterium]|nr:sigma-70 family RNA polymerase sigma factor [Bacillota bacterium]